MGGKSKKKGKKKKGFDLEKTMKEMDRKMKESIADVEKVIDDYT